MALNTIIVEDEPLSRVFLYNLLTEFCPDINVLAKLSTEDDAVESIRSLQPDLVFLDIELQQGTGFDVLKRISGHYPYIIFTTAFDHHAIKAIQFSGVDYLHKPIDIEGLQMAIQQAIEKKDCINRQLSITHLLGTLQNNYIPTHLSIPTDNGIDYIPLKDIIRIEACDADSCFVLRSGTVKKARRNLKEYELMLSNFDFFRIHQLHLVNTKEIKKLNTAEDQLHMSDGSVLPVSSKRKEEIKRLADAFISP